MNILFKNYRLITVASSTRVKDKTCNNYRVSSIKQEVKKTTILSTIPNSIPHPKTWKIFVYFNANSNEAAVHMNFHIFHFKQSAIISPLFFKLHHHCSLGPNDVTACVSIHERRTKKQFLLASIRRESTAQTVNKIRAVAAKRWR